ncbi:HWE histidine kinase domain-containing protein [Rhodoligotrophos defluvii]|uniref:HWE histidine kinase domain-containing protein n=1 Tax=Rhodoligotrophos defluvii TaxID=2561934 RepID=UPI0014852D72|nr:HWE histidine kinase domain-containing protein [Rhodoligotrophos defluvii]
MQDRHLRYVWVINPPLGLEASAILGRTDEELFNKSTVAQLEPIKHKVMLTGRRRRDDIFVDLPSGERRWYTICVDPFRSADGKVVGVSGSWTDVTEQRRLDERVLMLMREVAHRSKNMLSIVQGLANQTAKTSANVRDFVGKFTGRLLSLGHAQDLLTATDWKGASIAELVKVQLGPYLDAYGSRIHTRGRRLMLKSNAAQYLGLALHELVTNAVKHGTLSEPGGHVSVAWRLATSKRDGELYFVLVWSERGREKPVSDWQGDAGGFGRTMLTKIAPQAVQGEASIRFRPEGIIYRLTAPLEEIVVNGWAYYKGTQPKSGNPPETPG